MIKVKDAVEMKRALIYLMTKVSASNVYATNDRHENIRLDVLGGNLLVITKADFWMKRAVVIELEPSDMADCSIQVDGQELKKVVSAKAEKGGLLELGFPFMETFKSAVDEGSETNTTNQHHLTVKDEISEVKLETTAKGLSVDAWNFLGEMPEFEEIDVEEWKSALIGCGKAHSTDHDRPALNNVAIQADAEGWWNFVSTDGYRMHWYKVESFVTLPHRPQELFCGDAAELVGKYAKKDLQVAATEDAWWFQFGPEGTYYLKAHSAGDTNTFVAWKEIIKSLTDDRRMVIRRADTIKKLKAGLAQCSAGVRWKNDSENPSRFTLTPSNSPLGGVVEFIAVVEATLSDQTKELDPNVHFVLEAKYTIDALESFESTDVEISFSGVLSPMVFRSGSSPDITIIVMPKRL